MAGTSKVNLKVNDKDVSVDVEPEKPLLWVLREELGLSGTKFGCGKGLCGACTVHVNGVAVRSCVLPAASVAGAVTTIEGLGGTHVAQRAWIEADAPQCGYCQPGQIMTCAAMLKAKPHATDQDIQTAMINLCRCGTYGRVRKAFKLAVAMQAEGGRR